MPSSSASLDDIGRRIILGYILAFAMGLIIGIMLAMIALAPIRPHSFLDASPQPTQEAPCPK